MFKYIKTSTSLTEDENGLNKYIIPLSLDFSSEYIDIESQVLSFRAYSYDADGSGTLTLYYSHNNIDYEILKDSLGANVTWTIDGTDVDGYDAELPQVGYYKFVYDKGTNTEGTLIISASY